YSPFALLTIDSFPTRRSSDLYNEGFTEIYREFQATDIMSRVTDQMSNIFTATIDSIGNVAGIITREVITIATIPFVLYYLLVDGDRKSTRLNSSHVSISYAVF